MAVLVQLPRLPTNCPSRNSYINIQNGHLFKDPIGVFNPHTWPPNLEGVRGSPTATELITIDRQLFYDAMWGIWSFHPAIIRILSDNCGQLILITKMLLWLVSISPTAARHTVRERMTCEGWRAVSCHLYHHHRSHITTLITTLRPGLVVVMSCWEVLTGQHLLTITRGRPDPLLGYF